jgi:hypothetical protein
VSLSLERIDAAKMKALTDSDLTLGVSGTNVSILYCSDGTNAFKA